MTPKLRGYAVRWLLIARKRLLDPCITLKAPKGKHSEHTRRQEIDPSIAEQKDWENALFLEEVRWRSDGGVRNEGEGRMPSYKGPVIVRSLRSLKVLL